MSTVEIQDVGPVEHLTLPVPEGGGIVVLRGVNGAGKTKALEAVDRLTSGKGPVAVRDGALKGEVSGFGATLTVARSTRRRGELEVESLDGKLSIADLVDPPIKDPAAADAKRIRTLVGLAGTKPDPALFHDLVGGPEAFAKLIPLAEADDLVTLASRVKREFEGAARKDEDAAKKAHIKAEAHREAIGDLDLSEPVDRDDAYEELQAATVRHTELTEQDRMAVEAGKGAKEAREGLAAVEEAYDGPTTKETQAAIDTAVVAKADAKKAAEDAQQAARVADVAEEKAMRAYTAAKDAVGHATLAHKAAQEHADAMQAWRETLDKEAPAPPDPADVETAATRVLDARQAVSKLTAYEQAEQQQQQAASADLEETRHKVAAERMRDAARGTDDVLSGIVGKLGTPLKVQAGRLVLDTKRGKTYFHELSHGERWSEGLNIAVKVAGDRTIFTIPQEAWESLDPLNRAAVGRKVREKGIVVFTAEASADEVVRAEVRVTEDADDAPTAPAEESEET